jgi:hypothetical protein
VRFSQAFEDPFAGFSHLKFEEAPGSLKALIV